LYDVNIAKYNQYPELAARLLETKNATLGAYIPDDNLIGIGLSIDNIQAKNPVNWTGQNLLGKALMDIRQKIRSEQEAAAAMAAAVAQPVPRRKKQSMASPTAASVVATATLPSERLAETEDATAPSGPVPRPPRRRPIPATAPIAPTVVTATAPTNPVATALANVSAVEDIAVAKNIAEGLFI
jgi:hypothetical protein